MTAKNILLIDDEEIIQRLCRRVLDARGHRLRVAGTYAEGAALIAAESYDLLITDLRLPDGDGRDAVKLFHAARPGVPVLIMSGSPTEDNGAAEKSVPPGRFLQKPFDIAAFETLVQTVLEAA